MPESRELAAARLCLAEAEADWASADGLTRLADGLERLADVIAAGTNAGRDARGRAAQGAEAQTARNLAASYAGRFYAWVRERLEHDAQVPEPELEHYFKVVLAFDQVQQALPATAADLKIRVVEALIERYYEGHPLERKRAALEQLKALRPAR